MFIPFNMRILFSTTSTAYLYRSPLVLFCSSHQTTSSASQIALWYICTVYQTSATQIVVVLWHIYQTSATHIALWCNYISYFVTNAVILRYKNVDTRRWDKLVWSMYHSAICVALVGQMYHTAICVALVWEMYHSAICYALGLIDVSQCHLRCASLIDVRIQPKVQPI